MAGKGSWEICKRCGRKQQIGWAVSDDCWNRVSPEVYRGKILCLECFFEMADIRKKDVSIKDFLYLGVATDENVRRPVFLDIKMSVLKTVVNKLIGRRT